MIALKKNHCPSSEDFFYWPPEEIAHYHSWCDISRAQHRRRLKKINMDKKSSVAKPIADF